MNNKGQTTVLFSLMISVLFLFTLTALEAGRIYLSKVKIRAVVHSTRSAIMADYNSELFERYHLLFMDPTYGTGSDAAAEEKIKDYLETSLNGEQAIYHFTVEEAVLSEQKDILADDMQQLKEQIAEYEKTAGLINKAKDLWETLQNKESDIEGAAEETERNGVELPGEQGENEEVSENKMTGENKEEEVKERKVDDPRELLTEALKPGILAFLLPKGGTVSREIHDFSNAPSKEYEEKKEEERDGSFQNIQFLKSFLKQSAKEDSYNGLQRQAAFIDYSISNFSNAVSPREEAVMKCEVEYILKGRESDYDNLEGVVNEMIWLRMPVNYAYLLTDAQKKSEALTLAAAICTASGTMQMIEVVKYLLLGCWAYGETLYEMKQLLSGEKISYIKTGNSWCTDLKNPGTGGFLNKTEKGLDYEDFLMILLAKKGAKNTGYARLLDLIEINLQQTDQSFQLTDCVGGLTIQGKINVNPLFRKEREKEGYTFYFEKAFSYQ